MSGLTLADLGLGTAFADEPPVVEEVAEPGRQSLREAVLVDPAGRLAWTVAHLGVHFAGECLAAATRQMWGRRPEVMPSAVAVMTEGAGREPVERLDVLLGLSFSPRVCARILVLTQRHAQAFLDRFPSWHGQLADEGVSVEEMTRRSHLGEFDQSGPLPSTFDLSTLVPAR